MHQIEHLQFSKHFYFPVTAVHFITKRKTFPQTNLGEVFPPRSVLRSNKNRDREVLRKLT